MKNFQPYHEIFREDACPGPNIIMGYVKGTLSTDELRMMETHLSECEFCNDTIEALNKGLVTPEYYLATSERIQKNIVVQSKKGETAPRDNAKVIPLASRWKKYSTIAAAIALLVTAGLLLQNRFSFHPSNEADKYFKPYEFSNLRGAVNDSFEKGMAFYQKGDYRNALASLADIETPRAQFFAGISAYACGQFNSAEEKLNKVVDANDSYAIDARWYLALAYMKTSDYVKAANLLDEFISKDPHHQYADEAKKIAEQLRNYKP